MNVRRLQIPAVLAALTIGLAGCGNDPAHRHAANFDNTGVYVDAGPGPVSYELQISRELNGYSTEDSQYLRGMPAGTTAPAPDEEWYAVFMWAWNQTKHSEPTLPPSAFDIVDSLGNHYQPEKIDPSVNPYQWDSEVLQPKQTEPAPNTTAAYGPTNGKILVFKINISAYSNRPLVLEIRGGSAHKVEATIPLDQ